jgi:acyl-coenzyme A synthetase/AMP-(fatty) acid ligase/acyl carrier protein
MVKIANIYGPTETTIWSIFKHYYKQKEEVKKVALNKLFDNEKIAILDRNLTILPIGAIGELYIGGVGLARGYLNRPDLTAEKFIANPFQTEAERKVGKNSRLYKTGDLVRWLPCGNIEYIGRNDFQVKIRGYRIELGEIESVLASYPNIKQAVVIARDSKNELEGNKTDNKYLVGYYTSSQELDNEAIRDYLENKLPEYMVPVVLMHLDKLPLTINGKLDRKALPEPNFINEETYTAQVTELEEKLCRIWSEVLGIPFEKIGVRDDFFRLGGHSILAIKLMTRINKELNILVNVSTIFTANTVRTMSKLLNQTKYRVEYDEYIY